MPAAAANPALTMINLCNFSYDWVDNIPGDVSSFNSNLNVVWGPIEYTPPGALLSESLLYIVQGPIVTSSVDEYTVVIRGTNMLSWSSWTQEDFNIGTTVDFSTIVNGATAGAIISGGTNTGLGYLINDSPDPNNNNLSAQAYLQSIGIKNITQLNVAGHSLGGALTPPYFVYLCNQLFGGTPVGNANISTTCQIFTFAGPTPGNAIFNTYLKGYIAPGAPNWRYVNPFDIAPNCWWSLSNIENIYVNNGLSFGFPEDDLLPGYFAEIPAAPNDYSQPATGEVVLPGAFYDHFPDDDLWVSQAMYQHHSTTYIDLVAAL